MAGVVYWKNGAQGRASARRCRRHRRLSLCGFGRHSSRQISARGSLRMSRVARSNTARFAINYDGAMIDHMRHQYPPPDPALAIDFTVSHGRMTFLKGVPPLDNIEGAAHITGRTSTFTATTGTMQVGFDRNARAFSNGSFHIQHAELRPTPAQFSGPCRRQYRGRGRTAQFRRFKTSSSLCPLDPGRLKAAISTAHSGDRSQSLGRDQTRKRTSSSMSMRRRRNLPPKSCWAIRISVTPH